MSNSDIDFSGISGIEPSVWGHSEGLHRSSQRPRNLISYTLRPSPQEVDQAPSKPSALPQLRADAPAAHSDPCFGVPVFELRDVGF